MRRSRSSTTTMSTPSSSSSSSSAMKIRQVAPLLAISAVLLLSPSTTTPSNNTIDAFVLEPSRSLLARRTRIIIATKPCVSRAAAAPLSVSQILSQSDGGDNNSFNSMDKKRKRRQRDHDNSSSSDYSTQQYTISSLRDAKSSPRRRRQQLALTTTPRYYASSATVATMEQDSSSQQEVLDTLLSSNTINATTTTTTTTLVPNYLKRLDSLVEEAATAASAASLAAEDATSFGGKNNNGDNNNSNNNNVTNINNNPICRVVALSDGQIPASPAALPANLFAPPHYILRKLDDIYHAMSHEETRRLKYMEQRKEHSIPSILQSSTASSSSTYSSSSAETDDEKTKSSSSESSSSTTSSTTSTFDAKEEKKLVSVVRTSLEDAGFELLTRRDLDLCDALNAGYLLRLSISPDVSQLDPGIANEFYPEYFDDSANGGNNLKDNTTDFLFEGNVLVYWRGCSKEVSRGRLLLPKIDYLQASLVQRAAASVQRLLARTERGISSHVRRVTRKVAALSLRTARATVDTRVAKNRPSLRKKIRASLRNMRSLSSRQRALLLQQKGSSSNSSSGGSIPQQQATTFSSASASPTSAFFKLARYGGSKMRFGDSGPGGPMDALKPFVICENANGQGYCAPQNDKMAYNLEHGRDGNDNNNNDVDEEMYECINHGSLQCRYDQERLLAMNANNNINGDGEVTTTLDQLDQQQEQELPPMQLLERVSIRNIVDVFSRDGRRKLLRTLLAKSELVEPTYEEVVVVWRPLPPQSKASKLAQKWKPPQWVYDTADMFDIEGLPDIPKVPTKPDPQPLELRTFDDVPMSNIPAVLPKTKLVFRPADAFVFDFISIVSLLLAIGSQRFDSPKLDLLAIVSVSLWCVRLLIRYSNKLARYDLLVKTFLTSKISHRNAGALKYLATEAGSQRATRAGLVYSWLSGRSKNAHQSQDNDGTSLSTMNRQELLRNGPMQVNDLVQGKQVRVDVDAALNDLEDLKLISTTSTVPGPSGTWDGVNENEKQQQQVVTVVRDPDAVVDRLRHAWNRIFEGRLGLKKIIGRRRHGAGGGDGHSGMRGP